MAVELAAEGARISICSRSPEQIRKAAESIRNETGAKVHSERADVAQPEQIRTFVTNTLKRFGTVHVLVTNAGGPPAGLFASVSLAGHTQG